MHCAKAALNLPVQLRVFHPPLFRGQFAEPEVQYGLFIDIVCIHDSSPECLGGWRTLTRLSPNLKADTEIIPTRRESASDARFLHEKHV